MRSVIDHPYPTAKIQWIPDQVLCVCSIRVVEEPRALLQDTTYLIIQYIYQCSSYIISAIMIPQLSTTSIYIERRVQTVQLRLSVCISSGVAKSFKHLNTSLSYLQYKHSH